MDKFGRKFLDLLALQRRQLDQLQRVLQPGIHEELLQWCEIVNVPAEPHICGNQYKAGGLHSAPVGIELFNWLLAYGQDDSIL